MTSEAGHFVCACKLTQALTGVLSGLGIVLQTERSQV